MVGNESLHTKKSDWNFPELKPDDPCRFWHAKMKVGLPTYMPTADALTPSQTYGHENGEAIFIGKTSVIMQYPEPI